MENALYKKEAITLLRTRKACGMQVFYLLVLLGLTIVLWPQAGFQTLAAQASDTLFTALAMGQLVLLVLVTPAFSASSITYEKERNTLDILYGTRLTPRQILFAKLAGANILPLLLIVSSVPFSAFAYLLGGISAGDIAIVYVILIASGLLLGTMGVAISAYSNHSSTSVVIVYVTTIVLCGIVIVPAAMLIEYAKPPASDILHYVRSISPFQAMASALHPEWSNYGDYRAGQYLASWIEFLAVAAVGMVACVLAAFWRLQNPQAGLEARTAKDPDQGRTRTRRIIRRVYYLVDTGRKRKSLGLWSNAIFNKELRTSRLKSLSWLIRAVYLSLLLSLGLALMASFGSPFQSIGWMTQVLVIFQMTVIILIGPSMSAGSISGEVETNCFETLRMTRISMPSMLIGKLMAALLPLLLSVAAMLPAYFALAFIDTNYLKPIIWVIVLGGSTALFASAAGLFASTLFSRTSRATAAAYGIVGFFFVLSLLGLLAQGTLLSKEAVRWIYMFNPMIVGLEQMGLKSLEGFHLLVPHVQAVVALTLVMLIIAFVRLHHMTRPA